MNGVLLAQAGQSTELPPLELPPVEYSAMAPHLILIGGALALLVWVAMVRRRWPWMWAAFTVAVGLASLVASWLTWLHVEDEGPKTAVANAVVVDGYSAFFAVLVSAIVVLIVFLGVYPQRVLERINPSVERLVEHVEEKDGYRQRAVAERGRAGAQEAREDKEARQEAERKPEAGRRRGEVM